MKKHVLIFFMSLNTLLYSQGNLGINFGLNDDSFGSIENIQNTIDNYDLDLKNATGFQFGIYTEIDLITFYVRPELNFIFSKSNQGSTILSGNISEDILKHSFKSSEVQVPIIFGYNILGPISVFGGPSFKYNIKTRYRIVGTHYTKHNGNFIAEHEEVVVSTKTDVAGTTLCRVIPSHYESFQVIRVITSHSKSWTDG